MYYISFSLVRNVPYFLRPRVHDRELPVVSAAMKKNFIIRMLFLGTMAHAGILTCRLISEH